MIDMLGDHVLKAASRSNVVGAVKDLYARVAQEIDQRRPRCDQSGRCCRFDEFGHRLYVTTIELAAFVSELQSHGQDANGTHPGGCPFQVGKLCSVHEIRPFGCRVFFCDPTSTQWQEEQYERFHAELKRLHETLGVPYRYMEWRQALRSLLVGGSGCTPTVTPSRRILSLPQLRL